ncbi:unnamed protein product [Microthlaspi erraticum]|uniref:NYN domain-containing protein n=1 Tax=Microthlaspi erraticum TaxID=1685480 RepID=A0A6D2KI07_9BRAS|nr:unnamed protein product [Microthlaspi erraticum]
MLKYNGAEEASTQSKETGVWWDINICQVPQDFDPCKVRQKLESAFSHSLPTTVLAFGNLERIPPSVLEAISSTGIILRHDQEGEKKSIFLDMKRWTDENPPPATLVLISDREEHFVESGVLPSFEERGYTIIRSFQNHPKVPPNYASRTILWDYLLSAMSEDTKQELKDKYTLSETAWHCDICIVSGESVESLTRHLKSEEHKKQGLMSMSIDPCSSGEEEASTQSNKAIKRQSEASLNTSISRI